MRHSSILVLAILVLAILAGSCKGAPPAPLCVAGENIFCRCPGGEAGTKTCKADGQSFEACVTRAGACAAIPDTTASSSAASSSSGGGGGGGTGGGGTGGGAPLPLYQPCGADADCESGKCLDGYCTKDCAKFDDCTLGTGECIQFLGGQFCMPVCIDNTDCEDVYGAPSACGYTKAVDGTPVTTCADWEGALMLPPAGTNCSDDVDCNLGHTGVQMVCSSQTCKKGCFSQMDCPVNTTCTSSGATLGSCH
jgi:hypothetical protein